MNEKRCDKCNEVRNDLFLINWANMRLCRNCMEKELYGNKPETGRC